MVFFINICLKEGERWQKINFIQTIIIQCLSHKVCHLLSSALLLSKFTNNTWRKLPHRLHAWIASHQHNCNSFYFLTMTVVWLTMEIFYHYPISCGNEKLKYNQEIISYYFHLHGCNMGEPCRIPGIFLKGPACCF